MRDPELTFSCIAMASINYGYGAMQMNDMYCYTVRNSVSSISPVVCENLVTQCEEVGVTTLAINQSLQRGVNHSLLMESACLEIIVDDRR